MTRQQRATPQLPSALVGASDAEITAAVDAAHVPTLRSALGVLLGDAWALGDEPLGRYTVMDPQGGIVPELQQRFRDRAAALLTGLRDGTVAPAPPDRATVLDCLRPYFDDDELEDYVELSLEELSALDEDPRAPDWMLPPTEHRPRVCIIGAGMSGLLLARRLQQAGVPFVVYEKNADLGGTWLENRYPGCRVDVPSHLYTYTCAADGDWPEHFAQQAEVLDYFRRFAERHGLVEHIRFGCEVSALDFDEDTCTWAVQVRRGADVVTDRVEVVCSAVGQLNRPSLPDIPGRDRFGGRSFHTARWPDDLDLAEARVGVVGTGASGIQVVPAIADRVQHLTVFQRKPSWLVPTPELRQPLDDDHRLLFRAVPGYARWYRFWRLRQVSDPLLAFARHDPSWPHQARSVSARNDRVRTGFEAYLREQLAGHPDLLEACTPSFPPFAKRSVRDDGGWAAALRADHVELETAGIASVDESGVVLEDGRHVDLDVLVWATGFEASKFLVPMRVTGRAGKDLHEAWAGDPVAFLGTTVPGFPNLFLLYGPNTNIVANGSAIFFTECEVTYVVDAVRQITEQGGAFDVRADVVDGFRDEVDRGNQSMAWGCANVDSWYRSASGRVSQNWHSTVLEFWDRTRRFDTEHYHHLAGRASAAHDPIGASNA